MLVITSRPFLKNGGRYCFGVHRRLRHLSPRFALYLVVIKASFFKFALCNICKNDIAKKVLDFFKKFKIAHLIEVYFIFGKKSLARGITKSAGWIFTKFAMQVHLR